MEKKKKVLVVDDTVANLDLIVSFLGNKGYKCLIAKNGFDAITRAENTLPDIILLDIQMPHLDGYETCKRLKEMPVTAPIPIIFMTALSDTTDKVKGFNVGAVDYITKPIDSEELLARLETHLTIHQLKNDLEKSLHYKEELLKTQKELFKSEKMASLGYLVSGIAHEFNTPLGIGITSSTQINDDTMALLENFNIDSTEINNLLKSIITCNNLIFSNLNKLGLIIKKIKKLSISKSMENTSDINLKEFITECLKLTKAVLNNPKLEIRITGEDSIVECVNQEAIESIINNLFENSIVHGFKEDRLDNKIDIKIYKKDNLITIEFKDNGVGIKSENISKIFDPFFTTNKSRGTGLGLSVVFNIVTDVLKGTIIFENQKDGSVFTITYPTQKQNA